MDDIDEIVMVGGSSRMPILKNFIKLFSRGRITINDGKNPNEVVALGTALFAKILSGL